jgi:hypothetical protein
MTAPLPAGSPVNPRGVCRRTPLDGGSHGALGMLARFETGKRIESRGNTACRAPHSLRNFQLLAKLGQRLTHLHMPVLRFFTQPLQAFQQPERWLGQSSSGWRLR